MTPETTSRLANEAMQRLSYHINRMAAQQLRRMREKWAAQKQGSHCENQKT